MLSINYKALIFFIALSTLFPVVAEAGPPFDTDDPEPVDYEHWEFYCASHNANENNTWAGTAPHIEINYGVMHNVQLHIIAPMAYYSQAGEKTNYGPGDIELGTKYRFIQEDTNTLKPQIGIFPLLEIPTGNADKSLGNGNFQFYIPLWIQKSFGKWTTYGGGGYWFNHGDGNKNYGFAGWQAQYQVAKPVSLGGELYYVTASRYNTQEVTDNTIIPVYTQNELRFNIGMVIDFTDNHHLLFSIGKSLTGGTSLQGYIAYQLTI